MATKTALPPAEVLALLRHRLGRVQQLRAEAAGLVDSALKQDVPEVFLVEEEYRVAMLSTEEQFIDQLIAKISGPRWTGEWARFHESP